MCLRQADGRCAILYGVRVPRNRRASVRHTFLSLGLGELAAAVVFLVVASTVVSPWLGDDSSFALWAALVPLVVVLVQGGAYWLLARGWVLRSSMPASVAQVYRAFRVVDLALLAAGLVGVLVRLPERPVSALAVIGIWAFGVVEYVNYFVVRLAYPARGWVIDVRRGRRPRLVRDLAR